MTKGVRVVLLGLVLVAIVRAGGYIGSAAVRHGRSLSVWLWYPADPQYTTLAEDIASHGYLVAGVTPTYSANLTSLHHKAVPSTPTGNGPVVHRGLHAPLMIIGAANSCTTGTCRPTSAVERGIRSSARALLAASTGPTWSSTLDGTEHFNFTDYAAYHLAFPLRMLVPLGGIDGAIGLSTSDSYVTAFLDHAVRGRGEPLLADRQSR